MGTPQNNLGTLLGVPTRTLGTPALRQKGEREEVEDQHAQNWGVEAWCARVRGVVSMCVISMVLCLETLRALFRLS